MYPDIKQTFFFRNCTNFRFRNKSNSRSGQYTCFKGFPHACRLFTVRINIPILILCINSKTLEQFHCFSLPKHRQYFLRSSGTITPIIFFFLCKVSKIALSITCNKNLSAHLTLLINQKNFLSLIFTGNRRCHTGCSCTNNNRIPYPMLFCMFQDSISRIYPQLLRISSCFLSITIRSSSTI